MRGRAITLAMLFIALLVAPAQAAPALQGAIGGFGTAARFTVFSHGGTALEGGASEWTLVCNDCTIRIALTETDSLQAVQGGQVAPLTPGTYELREYRGYFSRSATTDGHSIVLAGLGHLARIA